MSIRLRRIEGTLVALCAARSVPQEGDIYLDDEAHEALFQKIEADLAAMNLVPVAHPRYVRLMEMGESNNPNREWWDKEYASDQR